MKLREQRGCLADSLATTIDIEPTTGALLKAIHAALLPYRISVESSAIHVEPYGLDARIGWDTHIVTIDGYGVFGFTDSPVVLPCPFCGNLDCVTGACDKGAYDMDGEFLHPLFDVWCSECDATGPVKDTLEDSITAWNTRRLA